MSVCCENCPRLCGADRTSGQVGVCGAGTLAKVARWDLHFWEEPCISGTKGSGTVFFSHCNLGCVFCQNRKISQEGMGQPVTEEELTEIFLALEQKGAHNLNLVTPTPYLDQIKPALHLARAKGLSLPVVYNCGGYERVEMVKDWQKEVDIWLPDLKYAKETLSAELSGAKDYFEIATKAIIQMVRQTGPPQFDDQGLMKSGVLIRHLPLPGQGEDSKKIIDFVSQFGTDVWFSLMNQYTPQEGCPVSWLDCSLPGEEYELLMDYCIAKGMEQVFVQEDSAADEIFIPEFYEKLPHLPKKEEK